MASVDRVAAARAIDAFLRALGRDPDTEAELIGTGERVAAAYADDLLAGYAMDVDELLLQSVFPGSSELVVVRDIPVTTICPHHLLPSSGHATVAFAPRQYLVGVGTVARVVEALSRRLALQEQIGDGVVAALLRHVDPGWVACRMVLSHACMTARGERVHGTRVETLAMAGSHVDRALACQAVGVGR